MRPDQPDGLDHLLDRALEDYGRTEVPAGLEGRTLSRLRAEEPVAPWWRQWWWLPLGAGAAAVVTVFAILLVPREQKLAPPPPTAAELSVPLESPPRVAAKPRQHRQPSPQPAVAAVSSWPARPAKFPAPSPASQQEQLLVELYNRQQAPVIATLARPETGPLKIETISISPLTVAPVTFDENSSQ